MTTPDSIACSRRPPAPSRSTATPSRASGATSCGTSTFAFSDVDAAPISYTQSTTTLLRNGQPIADNVSGLRFYCLQNDGQTYTTTPSAVYYVGVSMIVSTANASTTYRSMVRPRNIP